MEDITMEDGSCQPKGDSSSDMNSFNRDFSELMTELRDSNKCSNRLSGHSSIIVGDEEIGNNFGVGIINEDTEMTNLDEQIEDVKSISSSNSSEFSSREIIQELTTDQSTDDMETTAEPLIPVKTAKKRKVKMIPVDIVWEQGGSKVYVTGSFTGWTKMVGLLPIPNKTGMVHVRLKLPPGVHRFRFIVDNELRYSDYLPTATDQAGNFVNYLEVRTTDSTEFTRYLEDDTIATAKKMSAQSRIALNIKSEPDNVGDGFTRFFHEEPSDEEYQYTSKLPAVFTDPKIMEKYYVKLDFEKTKNHASYLLPTQLPPHLEHVILNDFPNTASTSNEIAHGGALSTPNHVVLHHLLTSSIRHGTLGLATAVRYKDKYITQVYYAPINKK